MAKPIIDSGELIFSFNDVKQLYISMWKRLIKWALIGGVLAFLYFANSSPIYVSEGSFKEGLEKTGPSSLFNEFMNGMISGITSDNQPVASSFMQSYQVLRPLVEKIGLQIYDRPTEWSFTKRVRGFKEMTQAEKGLPLVDLDPFIFQDVFYEAEKAFKFSLFFTDLEHFIVFSNNCKQEIAKGKIGEEVKIQEPLFRFTIAKTPDKIKMGSFYRFGAMDWISACKNVRKQIKIAQDKQSKSILNISCSNRNRHLATKIVNELMLQYRSYLKREYDQLGKEQLAYFENKQEQILSKMENLFTEHTDYLSENLKKNGVVGLEDEAQILLVPHQQMQNKLLSIDIELSRLAEIEKEGKTIQIAEESPFANAMNEIVQQIQEFKQQRDLLELSLCQISEHSLETRREELKEIRNQRFELEKMILEVDRGEEISSFDVHQGIVTWAKALSDPEEREDLAEYLENYSRLLSMREKMLQERVFYGNNVPNELEGIDLVSARNLFLHYNGQLDGAEASMRHYDQFKKEILNPDFELASLSSVLRDPICRKLIDEASSLELHLKDEKHHSSRERERWQEEIALHKKILITHLDQLYKVEEVNASLIREKMLGLQKLSLDCINRQVSVLHEQANDAIKERRQALLGEKKLLEKKMDEIRTKLAVILPEKWRFEKWLKIKTEMACKMMETLSEVVESKTVSNHLHHVESKPLDLAMTPTFPENPKLRLKVCFGILALPLFFFCLAFIRQMLRGFPTTIEKLLALKLSVSGPISAFCDGPSVETSTGPDLEALRKLAFFSEGAKVIALIGGKGPDYSYALGENLARMSAKSIVLRCDFLSKYRQEDCPGLLQVWKGEIGELPIRKGKGFDYITSGGYSPYGTEIIQSQSFSQLLEILKKNYHWVFILLRTPLSSAESISALRLCDKAVVTVSGEQTEELTPFVDWGYDGNHCRLTFIAQT